MEALWHDTTLIGRDKLLQHKIVPRIHSRTKRFVLKGEAGVGKTALLEWSHEHTEGRSALVSCAMQYSSLLRTIADAWGVAISGRPNVSELEEAILKETGHTLYVDDLHRATPKTMNLLKTLAERHKISGALRAGVSLKEDLRQFLWTCEVIQVPRLKNYYTRTLSEKICVLLGSKVSFHQVAHASGGLPGRIVAAATSGEVRRDEVRLASEEIDISPFLIFCAVCTVLLRVFGRAVGATDLAIIGGAAIIVLFVVRGLMRWGRER